jgi:hypothetical protein
MEIKILSSEDVEFKEKDVQAAFEKDLSKLEEGLEFISSEFETATGRIDTLAFDSNNGNTVFIVEIPRQTGHRFRSKSATHSACNRPLIPKQIGRAFRSKSATPWRGKVTLDN